MNNGLVLLFFIILGVNFADAHVTDKFLVLSVENNNFEHINIPEFLENKDDPAYQVYKDGYNLIIEGQWEKARKQFAKITSQYPKSTYIDDAVYWSAYALKHYDKKKAIEEYMKFIEKFPTSNYFDDAVADLTELQNDLSKVLSKVTVKEGGRVYITEDGLYMGDGEHSLHIGRDGIVIGSGKDSLFLDKYGIVGKHDGKSYSFDFSQKPRTRSIERVLKTYVERLERRSMISSYKNKLEDKNLDLETRLKLDALYALAEIKENEESFKTLKEIILDRKQPQLLRQVAMHVISDFKKFDALPIYTEIVKNDTTKDMQLYAIDLISQHKKDKNAAVNTLIDLFNSIPKRQVEQRQMIFYSIADIGNDKAVNFLATIARTDEDYELRREAIYYLGSIGGENARRTLYEILKSR